MFAQNAGNTYTRRWDTDCRDIYFMDDYLITDI